MEENKQVAKIEERAALVPMQFTESQVELIKKTVAKGTTNDELALFLYTCKKTGLDPLIRQIYAVKRGGASNQMSIQTGIDGYRLIAERSSKYAPGKEPLFKYDKDGKLFSATAYVNKLVNGVWHEVAATAIYSEYFTSSNHIWVKMPHAMLAKCAEALALRKAFPAEMSGIYTHEEMAQAEVVAVPVSTPPQRRSAQEPTAEELKALADRKAAEYAASRATPTNAIKTEPKAANGAKTAIGVVIAKSEPNKGGYVKYNLEGIQNDYGYDIGFSTNDSAIMETLNTKLEAGEKAGIEYVESISGKYTNYNIVGLVSVE